MEDHPNKMKLEAVEQHQTAAGLCKKYYESTGSVILIRFISY